MAAPRASAASAVSAPSSSAPAGTRTAVRLVQVRKTYPNGLGETEALRSVSVALLPGSFTAVMGPSGSGKSTFLNCAAGLDTPTSGQVIVGDVDLTALSADGLTQFRRRQVGFVFQSYNLVGHLTVAENIQLPLLLDGQRPDVTWQQELLHAVGLDGMEDRRPSQLSGGQAQRVAIARALVTRPTVVFADEPTGALDSHTGQQVLDVLRASTQQLGQTLVMVTHDAHVAAVADQVVFLADGRVVGHIESPTVEQITARLITAGR